MVMRRRFEKLCSPSLPSGWVVLQHEESLCRAVWGTSSSSTATEHRGARILFCLCEESSTGCRQTVPLREICTIWWDFKREGASYITGSLPGHVHGQRMLHHRHDPPMAAAATTMPLYRAHDSKDCMPAGAMQRGLPMSHLLAWCCGILLVW